MGREAVFKYQACARIRPVHKKYPDIKLYEILWGPPLCAILLSGALTSKLSHKGVRTLPGN